MQMVSTILAVLIGATFLVMQYARESGWRWKDIERKFNRTIEKNELTYATSVRYMSIAATSCVRRQGLSFFDHQALDGYTK